jgi:hypothetical protein
MKIDIEKISTQQCVLYKGKHAIDSQPLEDMSTVGMLLFFSHKALSSLKVLYGCGSEN